MDIDDTPVLDNHLHLDPVNGRNTEAAAEFADHGGTHLLVLNKPSWHLVEAADDFLGLCLPTGQLCSHILTSGGSDFGLSFRGRWPGSHAVPSAGRPPSGTTIPLPAIYTINRR